MHQHPFSPIGVARDFTSPRKKKNQLSFAQSSFMSSVGEDESLNDPKKAQNDVEFLYDQLRKVKQERDMLSERNDILTQQLNDAQAALKDASMRRGVEEESFRRGIRHEKTTNDRRLIKQTLKTQDRDNILLDWVNAVVSNRLDERHRYLAVLAQRTGVILPKARNLAHYISEQQDRAPQRYPDNVSLTQPDNYDVSNAESLARGSHHKVSALSQFNESLSVLDNFRDLESSMSELVQGYANYITTDNNKDGLGQHGNGNETAGEGTDNELIVFNSSDVYKYKETDALLATPGESKRQGNQHRDSPTSGTEFIRAGTGTAGKTKRKKTPATPSSAGGGRNTTSNISPRGKTTSGGGTRKRKTKSRTRGRNNNNRHSGNDDGSGDDTGNETGGRVTDDEEGRILLDTVTRSIIDYNALINNDLDTAGEDSMFKLDRAMNEAIFDYNLLNINLQNKERNSPTARSIATPSAAAAAVVAIDTYAASFTSSTELRNTSGGGKSPTVSNGYSKNMISTSNKFNYSRLNKSIDEGEIGEGSVRSMNSATTPTRYARERTQSGGSGGGGGGGVGVKLAAYTHLPDLQYDRLEGEDSRRASTDAGQDRSGLYSRDCDRLTLEEDVRATEDQLFNKYSTRSGAGSANPNAKGGREDNGPYNYDGLVNNILNTVSEINRSMAEEDIRDSVRTAARASPTGRITSASRSVASGGGGGGGGGLASISMSNAPSAQPSVSKDSTYTFNFDSSMGNGSKSVANKQQPLVLSATSRAAVEQMNASELYNMSESVSTMQQEANRMTEIKSVSSDKHWWDVSLDSGRGNNHKSNTVAAANRQLHQGQQGGREILKLGGDLDCDASV